MIRTIAYVLGSFPVPSETFIADELLSLYDQNVRPCILHTNDGNRSKIHPSAQSLLERANILKIASPSKAATVRSLFRLLLRSPLRTLSTLNFALRNPHRWLYIQSLFAAEWCLSQDVEFLHAHFADVNFLYASAISAWTGIPYGVTTHRYDIFEEPIEKSIAQALLERAKVIITISEFNRNYMGRKFGIPSSKIHLVHCGIDLERFCFSERKPIPPGQVINILNVGRLATEKAQDVLLKAMALARDAGGAFRLEIIGGGPREKGLREMRKGLNLSEEVVFHGVQTESFIRQRLADADLFVLSSRSEGIPVALMEALAAGVPVIATRISGIPEIIENGKNGILVSPDDPDALSRALLSVQSEPALLQKFSVAGRHVVENKFERVACTRQLVQIWSDAVTG